MIKYALYIEATGMKVGGGEAATQAALRLVPVPVGARLVVVTTGDDRDDFVLDRATGSVVPSPPPSVVDGVRLLVPADADALEDLVSTRSKMWTAEYLDLDQFVQSFRSGHATASDRAVMGLFHDGRLDAMSVLQLFAATPTEEKSAVGSMMVTRKRAGRVKTAHGWDVHATTLMTESLKYFEGAGTFAHWAVMPAAFKAHRENPDFELIQRYDRVVVEDVPAGKRASGPRAKFINTNLMHRPFVEDVSVRLSTLRPEFRPTT